MIITFLVPRLLRQSYREDRVDCLAAGVFRVGGRRAVDGLIG